MHTPMKADDRITHLVEVSHTLISYWSLMEPDGPLDERALPLAYEVANAWSRRIGWWYKRRDSYRLLTVLERPQDEIENSWDFYTEQIRECDRQIEEAGVQLDAISQEGEE